jgi:hypothetical protein
MVIKYDVRFLIHREGNSLYVTGRLGGSRVTASVVIGLVPTFSLLGRIKYRRKERKIMAFLGRLIYALILDT